MTTYVILSQISAKALEDPKEFKALAVVVADKIKKECRAVKWKASYATLGRFDAVDIIEADDPVQVQKVAVLIRSIGRSTTETLLATPWADFVDEL